MKTIIATATLFVLISSIIMAGTIEVPADYPTIQEAINASANGDTIVVSPATYFENINFRGKNVFLTSLYYLEADTSFISSTVIDGSSPAFPDTASCVIFNSGEDSTAVLQGFTITGGGGTIWTDIHGAGDYREGGGILIELSSPTIMHNIISYNACTDQTGVTSTGGGGIRIGDGNPVIVNNSIIHNVARYGAGIVVNYTGCTIVNNVIASNSGGEDYYGGSGIWIVGNSPGKIKNIFNNTIVNNTSTLSNGTGGISVWSSTQVNIKNNILWDNLPALQIRVTSATANVRYNDVQGGYIGVGNINSNPMFDIESYILDEMSPCVDKGDTSAVFNDLEDIDNLGMALFPSWGNLRNDMGAYGGPFAAIIPYVQTLTGIVDAQNTISEGLIYPNPSSGLFTFKGEGEVWIYDAGGRLIFSSWVNNSFIDLRNRPKGIYFVKMRVGEYVNSVKIIIER